MADVVINKFTTQILRDGATPSSPGFVVSEGQDPVNPPGTNNFVPYSGAISNVELGEYGLESGFITLDTTPTGTPPDQGTIYWDDSKSTAALIMNGTTQHIGQDTYFYVKNSTGSNIAKGVAVRFDGTDGASGHLKIAPFLADGTYPSAYFMGVTAEAIDNGEFGQVTNFGEIEGIDTSIYSAGDLLYASTTSAGAFQTTAPVAPNNIVLIAAAVNSKNNGAIIVRPTYGSNINDDEGVKIVSPTTGDLLQLQASGLWENKPLATVLTDYVTLNTSQTITGEKLFSSLTTFYNASSYTEQARFGGGVNNRYLYTYVDDYGVGLSTGTGFAGESIYFNPVSNNIDFSIASSSKMRLVSGGGLEIGYYSIQNAYKLDVNGTGRFSSSLTVSSNFAIGGTITSLSDTDELSIFAGTTIVDNRSRIELYGPSHSTLANQTFVRGTQIVFTSSAAATERMRIDSSGSVGIGTSSPSNLLTIKNNLAGTNGIDFQNYASTSMLGSIFYEQTNDTFNIVNNSAYSLGGVVIKTNNTERMRITSGGNVLIGTTTDSGYKCEIQTGSTNAALWVQTGGTTSSYTIADFRTGTNLPALQILGNGVSYFGGRVGIGQTSPDARLHVEVPAESPATGAVALLAKTSNGANDIFRWFDGSTQLGVFKNNGNVLIGTTTDSGFKLQVNGEGRFYQPATTSTAYLRVENNRSRNAAIRLTTTVGDYYLGVGIGADVNQFQIYDGNAGANRLTISSTGAATFSSSVSVNGASNTTALNVQASGANGILLDQNSADSASSTRIFFKMNTQTYAMLADTNGLNFMTGAGAGSTSGTPRVTITSSGSVGIGTNSPNAPLQVTGQSASPNNGFFLSTNSFTFLSSGSLLRMGHIASSGNTTAIIQNLTLGGTGVGNIAFPEGNVLIGTTTDAGSKLRVNQSGIAWAQIIDHSNASAQFYIDFRYNGTGTGSIIGYSTYTNYNTTSDYRLKEDLKQVNGLDKIKAINVYNYKWKSSQDRMDGVLAHELAEVLPYAVSGQKDGEQMQGVDYSKIVPLLIQSIKELKQEIDTLKN